MIPKTTAEHFSQVPHVEDSLFRITSKRGPSRKTLCLFYRIKCVGKNREALFSRPRRARDDNEAESKFAAISRAKIKDEGDIKLAARLLVASRVASSRASRNKSPLFASKASSASQLLGYLQTSVETSMLGEWELCANWKCEIRLWKKILEEVLKMGIWRKICGTLQVKAVSLFRSLQIENILRVGQSSVNN